jgi:hypothetical protein
MKYCHQLKVAKMTIEYALGENEILYVMNVRGIILQSDLPSMGEEISPELVITIPKTLFTQKILNCRGAYCDSAVETRRKGAGGIPLYKSVYLARVESEYLMELKKPLLSALKSYAVDPSYLQRQMESTENLLRDRQRHLESLYKKVELCGLKMNVTSDVFLNAYAFLYGKRVNSSRMYREVSLCENCMQIYLRLDKFRDEFEAKMKSPIQPPKAHPAVPWHERLSQPSNRRRRS